MFKFSHGCKTGNMQSNTSVGFGLQHTSSEASHALPQKVPSPSQPSQVTSQRAMAIPNKLTTIPAKPRCLVKPSTGLNSLIQKAAFAAGGRIANPSTAASLFKAAQSKNAVRIRPRGAPPISQVGVTKPSSSATISVPHSNASQNCLPPIILPSTGIGSQQTSCHFSKLAGQTAPKTVQISRPLPPPLHGELRLTIPVNDTALNTDANTSRTVLSSDVSSALFKEEIQDSEKQVIDSTSGQGHVTPIETTVNNFIGGDRNTMVNSDVENKKFRVTDQDHVSSPENMDIDDDQITFVNMDAEDGRNIIVDSVARPSSEVDVEHGIMANLVDVGMISKSPPLVVTQNNIIQLKSDGPIQKEEVYNSGSINNQNSTTIENVDTESLVRANDENMVISDVEDPKASAIDSCIDQEIVTSPENMDIDNDQIAVNLNAEDADYGIMVNLVDVGMPSKSTPLVVTNNDIIELKSDGPIEKVVHNSGATNNKNSTTVENVDMEKKETSVSVNEAVIADGNFSIANDQDKEKLINEKPTDGNNLVTSEQSNTPKE